MPVVFEDFDLPCGDEFSSAPAARVEITLWGAGRPVAGYTTGGKVVVGTSSHFPNEAGVWSCDLVSNDEIIPENTTYRIRRVIAGCYADDTYISVPATGGPFAAATIQDDPLGMIAPSALSAHAADLDLHGGGIEVAYAERVTNVSVTGSAAGFGSASEVPGLAIDIPDLARPVWIELQTQVSAVTGTVTAIVGVGVTNPSGTQLSILSLLDLATLKSVVVDLNSPVRSPRVAYRLPPHSAGNYSMYAMRADAPYNITLVSSTIMKSWIRAIAA